MWIDCEMTGLDLDDDALVELAVLVTDTELNVLGDGVDVVIRPPDAALDKWATSSGTCTPRPAARGAGAGITLAEAEEQVIDVHQGVRARAAQGPMAGNSIATDRGFIARDMPSSTSTCTTGWWTSRRSRSWPGGGIRGRTSRRRAKHGGHRALADINERIDELAYYREAVFVPEPGPDTDTAEAIAAAVRWPPADGFGGPIRSALCAAC